MNYILDGILLLVLLIFLVVGVRRGFVRSAFHFVGAVFASFLSSALGGAAARWVFNSLSRQSLIERVEKTMNTAGLESVSAALRDVFESLPDFLVRVLEENNLTPSVLEGRLAHGTGQAAELVADSLAPVFVSFLKVLAVVVLFALFMMIVRALGEVVSRMFRLPLLRQVDGLIGGVFGFLLGLIVIWIIVSGLQVFAPMLSTDAQADLEIALNHSILAGLLVQLNPMSSMF